LTSTPSPNLPLLTCVQDLETSFLDTTQPNKIQKCILCKLVEFARGQAFKEEDSSKTEGAETGIGNFDKSFKWFEDWNKKEFIKEHERNRKLADKGKSKFSLDSLDSIEDELTEIEDFKDFWEKDWTVKVSRG
jgi:hypothetical protein